ncbi:5-oxoprolinase subunit PxpA [Vibrio ostreicida]|uniref:5-oxoprolinase subunit A n=1 Tax=Vibrio ostreicida TaxID=526588 RepID=A0ABT8BWN6_9VIBR|nr:5-oxoprolinase subunit PxpA [Vibrio ostreicida]MDN3611597.1 5-oxoprolinase subunit PxpA [Vibrio ostreicida]NPD09088.1 5-oxoprolinase subunit PxpA [Vibrio ostreicida]
MTKRSITLNCDMGESFGRWKMGHDDLVMPWIDMANIACGFHASDPQVMATTIKLALEHDVQIGAHPSYPDLQGFGRRSLPMSSEEITNMVIYQIGALKSMCESQNTQLNYVKPHGALYNDMIREVRVFDAVADAVACFDVPIMMLALSDSDRHLDIADKYELPVLFEAFADRTYQSNGLLTPRSMPGAVLYREEDILDQIKQIVDYGKVRTIDGCLIPIEADTICVHGDNPQAIAMIEKISSVIPR